MTIHSHAGAVFNGWSRRLWINLFLAVASSYAFGQTAVPPSDPQAAEFAAQAIQAIAGSQTIKDVTLTGQATWNAGEPQNGSITLIASGSGESRFDVTLSGGTRTEIRDASAGYPQGKWLNPDGTSGPFAGHNTMTDAVWFFPALGSLAGGPNIVLSYVGLENRNGESVQHLRSYAFQSISATAVASFLQQLSVMDFYIDSASFLPVAIKFNVHPDNNASNNLAAEVDFANYMVIDGIKVPTHIQRYQQGALMLDITVSSATFNTGVPLTTFSTN